VLQQPSVVAAAAAAVEADPRASICSLWNADIASAAELEMKELEALISKYCADALLLMFVGYSTMQMGTVVE
jgi:hypothetical protein